MKFSFLNEMLYEFRSLSRCYPDFVCRRDCSRLSEEIPVFVYHTINPGEFESHLSFLKDGGYRPLSIEDFRRILAGERQPGGREVLLTIDDGRSSFWIYGYPLLKKYGMRATLFIVPGVIPEDAGERHNLEDHWAGRCSLEQLYGQDPDDAGLCGWEEIKKMYASGHVDVESHSLFHKETFTGSEIIDFIGPETPHTLYNSPHSPYYTLDDIGKIRRENYYGLPLFKARPLLEAGTCFVVNEEVKDYCRDYYLENRHHGNWKERLRRELAERFGNAIATVMPPDALQRLISEETARSVAMIKERVSPDAGDYLCLPYSCGSDMVVDIVRKLGMKGCFWGVREDRKINRQGDDPFYSVRIKSDFLWRLPSPRRKSLMAIYGGKLARRLRREHYY